MPALPRPLVARDGGAEAGGAQLSVVDGAHDSPYNARIVKPSRGPRKLLPAATVARLLGVSTHTLGRWRRAGVGPPWMQLEGPEDGPGSIRYPRQELESWLERRTVYPESEA